MIGNKVTVSFHGRFLDGRGHKENDLDGVNTVITCTIGKISSIEPIGGKMNTLIRLFDSDGVSINQKKFLCFEPFDVVKQKIETATTLSHSSTAKNETDKEGSTIKEGTVNMIPPAPDVLNE